MIDLLGLDSEDAADLLSKRGFLCITEVTKPPRRQLDNGCLKVIKQELTGITYRLTLCKVPDSFR